MKSSDMRTDSWFQIIKEIERGNRPADKDLCAAFMRGEPLSLEKQQVIAKLFNRSLHKGRGRPKKNGIADRAMARLNRQQHDFCLWLFVTERAEDLQKAGAHDPLGAAIQEVANDRNTATATVRRQYRRGKRLAVTE